MTVTLGIYLIDIRDVEIFQVFHAPREIYVCRLSVQLPNPLYINLGGIATPQITNAYHNPWQSIKSDHFVSNFIILARISIPTSS